MDGQPPPCRGSKNKKQGINNSHANKDGAPVNDLWTDGLICAFEFIRGHNWTSPNLSRAQTSLNPKKQAAKCGLDSMSGENLGESISLDSSSLINVSKLMQTEIGCTEEVSQFDDRKAMPKYVRGPSDSYWVPIGWTRISELVQRVQTDASWELEQIDLIEDEEDFTVADVAAPYWERPAGPTWWCHVTVPVRVAGGLLFELLGQSAGDPSNDEDDIPIVLRSWQAQNFLITTLHIKGPASNINVLGITEVQELLLAAGSSAPKSIHEVIAQLACRLARWDDRLFRKYVLGGADEIELKFVNRRNHEDLNLLCIIFNQEIRRLATQVIRVKWSLHAREEIIFELLQHLRGNATKALLEGINKSTREMLEEQEAVRGRLFTIQDVMQSTVRAWLQDRSLRVTHNLTIFGGCGLVLSIITGLFGINVDGILGAERSPYAFYLFSGLLFFIGIALIALGIIYFGLEDPITEEQVQMRKLELQQLVSMFQHEAETHAKVREGISQHNLPPRAADVLSEKSYLLIS